MSAMAIWITSLAMDAPSEVGVGNLTTGLVADRFGS